MHGMPGSDAMYIIYIYFILCYLLYIEYIILYFFLGKIDAAGRTHECKREVRYTFFEVRCTKLGGGP